MERDSLALRAQAEAKKKLEKYIEEKKRELQLHIDEKQREYNHLSTILQSQKEAKFAEIYGESADSVMKKYVKRLQECCGQGGSGYSWWLHKQYSRYMPSYHHCVVLPQEYQKAQPTQKELDAYWVMTETEMKVTQKPHMEIWGN